MAADAFQSARSALSTACASGKTQRDKAKREHGPLLAQLVPAALKALPRERPPAPLAEADVAQLERAGGGAVRARAPRLLGLDNEALCYNVASRSYALGCAAPLELTRRLIASLSQPPSGDAAATDADAGRAAGAAAAAAVAARRGAPRRASSR